MKIKSRAIRRKEAEQLLRESGWKLDHAFSTPTMAVYFSEDDRGLVLASDGIGRLYESGEALRALSEQAVADAKEGPKHLLEGRLPQGGRFLEYVPDLLRELPELLGVPAAELDGSEKSLSEIDRAVRRKGRGKCNTPPIFPALVAYVGELIRRRTGGSWRLELAGRVWEPWIMTLSGLRAAPFGIVFKELYESGGSIRGAVGGQLRSMGVPPEDRERL